jgi:hypothetical protein
MRAGLFVHDGGQDGFSQPPAPTKGAFRYLAPIAERPYAYCYEPTAGTTRSNYSWDVRMLPVADLRNESAALSWQEDGIILVTHGAPLVELGDAEALRADWYERACDLIRDKTGARGAIVFDHTFRKNIRAGESTPECRPPVEQVHVDGVDHIAANFVRRHHPDAAERWLAGRWQIINIWRPLNQRVEDMPLGFCDGRGIRADDLVPTDLLFPEGRRAITYQLNWREDHRWRYFSDMTAGEAVLFKCFDSALDAPVRFVPHSSFRDARCADAEPRKSVELRVLAYFGD